MEPDHAVRLRRAINMLARQFNSSSTDEGLAPSQASVLGLIVGWGPLSMSELVRREQINPTMLSRIVARLDSLGLIVRTPDPNNLRSATVTATAAGRRTHKRIHAQRAAVVAKSASRLSSAEVADLIRALPALETLAEANYDPVKDRND